MSHLTSGTDVKDGFPDVKGGGHEVVCDLVVVREDEVVESYSCHYHWAVNECNSSKFKVVAYNILATIDFFNFQSGNSSKVVWFQVFAQSYRAPVESTLCSRWVICGHISSNVEFSLHLGKTIKQSGRDMFVCKLMKKWISLACLPTWWLRPAQRCRRRPHTRPAPPQSCRRGQVKTHSVWGVFIWGVSQNIPRSCKTAPAPWGTGLLIGSVLLVPLDVLLVEFALRSNRSDGTTWFEWFSGVQALFSILTRLKRLKTWFWPYSCPPW